MLLEKFHTCVRSNTSSAQVTSFKMGLELAQRITFVPRRSSSSVNGIAPDRVRLAQSIILSHAEIIFLIHGYINLITYIFKVTDQPLGKQINLVYVQTIQNLVYVQTIKNLLYVQTIKNLVYVQTIHNLVYMQTIQNLVYVETIKNLVYVQTIQNLVFITYRL